MTISLATQAILDMARQRDNSEKHANAMYFAIKAFRKVEALKECKQLRATPEFAALVRAFKAYDTEVNSMSFKDKLTDVLEPSDQ